MKQNPKFKEVSKQQADGMAWAFDSKDSQPRQYYFKFPELQPTQVRLRVLYVAICRTDVNMVRKGYLGDSQPISPGHQIVGRVQTIGNKVTSRKIGDIVGVGYKKGSCNECKWCITGNDQICYDHKNMRTIYPDIGGFSTHMQAQQDWTFIIPNNLQLKKVAPLFCAGITVYNPLESKCHKGDKVAIIGIGGLGHLGLKFGHNMGFNVTAFSSSDKKQGEAKQFGADQYIISTKENLTKNQGQFDVVIMTAGGTPQDFEKYFRLVKPSGKICVATVLDPAPEVSFGSLIHDERQYHGVLIGNKRQFVEMLKFCSDHNIVSQCQHFDFMDFKKAFERTQKGDTKYRVVLKVDENLMKK